MKRTNWLLVAFLLINAIGCYADGNGVLYVSPKGDDRNAGTLSHPLKTIGAALGKMKEITAGQQVEVMLRGGTYEIDATLEVNRDHVFIHPYQDETVTISGGKSVTRNSLKPVKEQAVLDRLQPQVRSLIREIDFKKTGWSWWGCTLQVLDGPVRWHGQKYLWMVSLCELPVGRMTLRL